MFIGSMSMSKNVLILADMNSGVLFFFFGDHAVPMLRFAALAPYQS